MFLQRNPEYLGIYIHFPFCLQKCYYCDFFSISILENRLNIQEIESLFVKRIIEELEFRYPYFQHFTTINTIYFGGGTSSFLSPKSIHTILNAIENRFSLSNACEITLEGNPEHLYDANYLYALKETRVNRINIGFQTRNIHFLQTMNRYFDLSHYESVLDTASSIFENCGVDIIYGYPNQNWENFVEDIQFIIQFPIKHISAYSLTVEAGTIYDKLIQTSQIQKPEEKLQEEIFERLPSILKKFDFQNYEISNFSLSGFECRHNIRYWLYEPYLGLGPSAHGFNGIYRYHNYKNWKKWLYQFHENYTLHEPLKEIAITMFRLLYPINLNWIQTITGDIEIFYDFFQDLSKKQYGKLFSNHDTIFFQWEPRGIQILDSLLLDFFQKIDSSSRKKNRTVSSI